LNISPLFFRAKSPSARHPPNLARRTGATETRIGTSTKFGQAANSPRDDLSLGFQ